MAFRNAIASPEGRLAFVHLNEPETKGQYASNKYCTTFIFPKTADIGPMLNECLATAIEKWPTLGIKSAEQLILPIRDGAEKASMAAMNGCYFMKCKSRSKPRVRGADRLPYDGPIRSGDHARIAILAWPYEAKIADKNTVKPLQAAGILISQGKNDKGDTYFWRPAVTFLLDGVQWLRQGDPIGSGPAADPFASDIDDIM